MERNYQYDVNTIKEEQMIDLEMTQEEAQFLLDYRNRFKLLEGDESALVSLEQLWEVLEKPYGRYDAWLDQMVKPECEKLFTEISVKRLPTKGRPKNNSFVNTDAAKHLAMMSRTEAGCIVRRYFITIEKLFKKVCEHNSLRINIEKTGKKVSRNGFVTGGTWKGVNDKKRFNYLVSTISGKRNSFSTDLYETNRIGEMVSYMMLKNNTDEQILKVLL